MPDVVRVPTFAHLPGALSAWVDVASRAAGAHVLLAVGASTLPLYATLPTDDARWARKRILPLDELIPAPAGRSFSELLRAALPVELRARLDDLGEDPTAVEARLGRDGICAAVLGLGPDGHIAFNQPGSDAGSVTRIVAITPENQARLEHQAPRALSVGVATILRASHIALIASGDSKRAALARVLDGPSGADIPASLLRDHPGLSVFIDEATCA